MPDTIGKLIINVFQIYVVFKISLFTAKLFTGNLRLRNKRTSKGGKKHLIISKILTLITNPIIYKLDDAIYEQKQKRLEAIEERQAFSSSASNVIQFKNIIKKSAQ